VSDESIERKINNSLLRVQERHLERIKELEQENAKLKERLKDAESVILTFKKYTDDLIYLTDVEMEIIILNYLEKWGE
jgi:predicted PP-loop superfamily ATPase